MTFASNNEHSEHNDNNNNRDHEDEMRMNTSMQTPQQAPPSPPPTDSSSHSSDTDQIGDPTAHTELQQQLVNVHTNNHMNNDESYAITQSTIDQPSSSTSIINEQQQHEQQYQQEPSTPPSEMEHNELVQSANKPPPPSPSHSPTRTTSSSPSSLSLSAITNEKDAFNQSTLTIEQKSMTTTIDNRNNNNNNNNTTDDEQNIVVSDHHCQSPAAAATTAVTPLSNEQSIFLQNFNALGDLPLHLLNNIDFSFALPFPNIDANSMANNSADVSSFVSLQLPPLDPMTFQLPPSLAAQHSGHSSPPKPQRMNAVATAHDDDDGADDEMQGTSNEQQQNESQHASTFFPNDIKESMIEILHKLTMTQLVSLLETNKLFNKVTVRAKLSKKSARRSRRAKDSGTLEYAESAVIRKKYYIAIVDYIVSVGAKHFFAELDRSDMRATLKELIEKYDPSSGEELITSEEKKIVAQQVGDVDKLIKSQLRPYVKEYYKLLGFEGVMKELSHNTLKLYREVLEFPENEAENNEKETLMDAVLEEIFLHGAKHFLGKCKKDFLCQCAKRFGCSVKDGIQKDHVVALILSQEFSTLATDSLRSIYSTIPIEQPEPDSESESDQELQPDVPEKVHTPRQKTLRSESEDEQKTPSRIKVRVKHRDNDRPSIKKGVTLDDLLGFYLHEELRNFCRYNKMNYNGSKNDFAERILKYLEENEPIWQLPPIKKKRAREEKPVDDADELNFSSSSDEETTKPRKQHTPKKDSVVRASKKPRLSSARGQQESLVLERRPVVLLTPKQPPKKSITMAPASTKKSVEPQEKSQTSHLTVSERMAPTSFAVTHDIPRESTPLQTSEPPRSPAQDSYQQTENTLQEVTPENVVINKAEREIAANVTEEEIEQGIEMGIEMEIKMETEKVRENIAEIATESVAENVVEQVTEEVTVPSTSKMEHEEMYHESEQTQIPMQPERPYESPSEEPINTSLKEIEMEFAMETEMEDEKSPEELIPIIYDSQPTTNEEETHLKKPQDIDLNSDDEEDLEFDVIMDIDSDDEQPASRTIEVPQDTVEVNEYVSDEEDDDIIINLDED